MSPRTLFALACLASTSLAGAAEPTRWNCVYAPAEGEFIACQLVSVPIEGVSSRPAVAGHERLPKLVREIRDDPQSVDDRTIVIPLHNAPIDMALTGRLARSVMCGTRPDCEVAFHAERKGLVEATHSGVRRTPSRAAPVHASSARPK